MAKLSRNLLIIGDKSFHKSLKSSIHHLGYMNVDVVKPSLVDQPVVRRVYATVLIDIAPFSSFTPVQKIIQKLWMRQHVPSHFLLVGNRRITAELLDSPVKYTESMESLPSVSEFVSRLRVGVHSFLDRYALVEKIEDSQKLQQNLISSERVKTQLASICEYDLKAPIEIVRSSSKIIRKELTEEKEGYLGSFVERILKQAGIADETLLRMHELLIHETLPTRRIKFNLSDAVFELANTFRMRFSKQNTRFTVVPFEDIHVEIDLDYFQTALQTALGFVFQRTSDGDDVVVTITKFIGRRRLDNFAKLLKMTITDTGEAISPSIIDSINSSNRRGKVSLDQDVKQIHNELHFAKRICLAHGGNLYLNPEGNKENQITLTMPIIAKTEDFSVDDAEFNVARAGHNVLTENIHDGEAKNLVLVALADSEIRDQLVQMVGERYSVLFANDGVEALYLLRKFVPAVLVCDERLEKIDGVELAHYAREINATVKVLLKTDSTNLETFKRLSKLAGLDQVFSFPMRDEDRTLILELIA